MPDTDIRLMIGGGVVVLLLIVLLIVRSRKKPEPAPPVHVPPNPFDKPPVSGPMSTPTPGPISGPGPVSGPVSSPLHAGHISTPGSAAPVSGRTSSPGTSNAADVDALLAGEVTEGGTQVMARPDLPPEHAEDRSSPLPRPMAALDQDEDLPTQMLEHPPVSLEADALEPVPSKEPAALDAPIAPAPSPPPAPTAKPTPPAAPKPLTPSTREPVAKAAPVSEPAIKAPAPAPVAAKPSPATPARAKLPSRPDVPQDAELDFSALRDAKKSDPKLGAAAPAPAAAQKYAPAASPETADLEKSDPRHAAARRLARLSVSEIKLYHEAEVKEGREKKDLWKRLIADITLAVQTYDKRVDAEVRDRFDYIHDEIVRQLADGNAELLGADAPKPKVAAAAPAPAPAAAEAAEPAAEAKAEPVPVPESGKVTAPAVTRPGIAPPNPETAELEKSDPRHAAARRLARLSVSEIKLYHEAEVVEGRVKKDLYTRLGADISLAKQTFEKRVDQQVRDRFDYLYDEIVRQLAEGNDELLGPGAPPKPKPGIAAPAATPAPAPAEAKVEAKPAAAPQPILPKSEPKLEAKAEPKPEPEPAKVEAPKPAEAAKPTMPGVKYAPPSNPETAELEKSDPRHAAARRLARLSVSEIKLYHEAEVTEGRLKKDLYSRLGADISLAKQTFEKRVDQEVRDRFDYLYDEIVRQLAEGNDELLGRDAPPPPKKRPVDAAPAPAPAPAPALVVAPPAPAPVPASVHDAVTAEPPRVEPKVEAPKEEPKAASPAPAPATPAAAAPAASAATQPSAVSKYLAPSNPATAELEKSDPRHAAARRLARLSVSEIKLYHEADVTEGRVKKDLWTRLQGDIALAKQTYDKRVDAEVRDRFDYLYDEILRQLAEGDSEKLGPEAPKPKATAN